MVIKITEQGLALSSWRVPGRGRVVPFEEIVGASFDDNGHGPVLTLRLAGRPDRVVRGLPPEEIRALAASLGELLDPVAARPGRPLLPAQIETAVGELCSRPGARPSVILRFLLDQALRHRATDLHLTACGAEYQVRLRVDGTLHQVARIPEAFKSRLIAHIKNAAGLASYRRDLPQEGRLSFASDGGAATELRLSVVPAHGEESLALRLFDQLRGSLDLDCLGFSAAVRDGYLRLLSRPRGLILVSGPSASGKTTTLYASLSRLVSGPRAGQRAVSLEDPIEFPLAGVSQIEVAQSRELTFDRLLANVLRQDAEVIMVGEVRDEATAGIAVRAALTGHLILSTVHCGSAAEASRRLVNLGADPSAVGEALAGVLAQRLIRVNCPECAAPRPVLAAERDDLALPAELAMVHEGQGCDHCLGSGYYGRTAVAELILTTPAITALIEDRAPAARIREAAAGQPGAAMMADAIDKLGRGLTNPAEIRRVLG
jgi:general secretion pathway protein E